jgi:hypothetical protein
MTKRASSLVLVLANLIPLLGVVVFEWGVLSILLLYWAENVVIGILNVARMLTCVGNDALVGILRLANRPIPEEIVQSLPRVSANALKVFLIPFFLVHYGMFCFGHLMFVLAIFSDGGLRSGSGSALAELWQSSFWIAIAAVFVSHLYSFFTNYIGGGEYKRASLFLLMHRPYGRIIAMHVAVVLGAGLVMYLGSPMPILLTLILVKTFIDVRLHEKERSKLSEAGLVQA